MTGNKYTVERRNFENWSSTQPIAMKIFKMKLAGFKNRGIPALKTLPGKVIPQTLTWPEGSGVQTREDLGTRLTSYHIWPPLSALGTC